MDKVSIEGLRIEAYIGIFDWEQEITQPLDISVEMNWDTRVAGETGALKYALDYAAVSATIRALVQSKSWGLIEEVAEHVAQLILTDFKVPQVQVQVKKPTAVAHANYVAVTITRSLDKNP